MKIDLKDVTFLILIRLDSVERLENIVAVTGIMQRYFDTNIIVIEAARYNSGILKSIFSRKITYKYIEDKDPVLYKTKYFNIAIKDVETPFLAIWDADIVPDKKAVLKLVEKLRSGDADAGFPYDGRCLDVPDIIRMLYIKKKDIRILYRNTNKMELLYGIPLVGGAVFIRKDEYLKIGMENEAYYGWGNDDFDRYHRFLKYKLKIHQGDGFLFHLTHPRGQNSVYCSKIKEQVSSRELRKTKNMIIETPEAEKEIE